MKSINPVSILLFIACVLVSCSPAPSTERLIKPSNKINGMRVNRYGHTNAANIWNYCSHALTEEPGVQTTDCRIPMVDELFLGAGIFGEDKAQLEALWEARTWELSIDGYPIDLPSFNIADFDAEEGEETHHYRVWRIRLRNLTLGEHSLHYVMHVNQAVPGDPASQTPGTYELVVNFTVEE